MSKSVSSAEMAEATGMNESTMSNKLVRQRRRSCLRKYGYRFLNQPHCPISPLCVYGWPYRSCPFPFIRQVSENMNAPLCLCKKLIDKLCNQLQFGLCFASCCGKHMIFTYNLWKLLHQKDIILSNIKLRRIFFFTNKHVTNDFIPLK